MNKSKNNRIMERIKNYKNTEKGVMKNNEIIDGMKNYKNTEKGVMKNHEVIEGLKDYKIIKKDALKYIVNPHGVVVSEGYHDFIVFKVKNHTALIGQVGAMQKLLMLPTDLDNFFRESKIEFHDIWYDEEIDFLICKTGAMRYLVDSFGNIISKGYYDFSRVGNQIFGERGANPELVFEGEYDNLQITSSVKKAINRVTETK